MFMESLISRPELENTRKWHGIRAVADAASAATVRRAGKLLRVLAQHLLDGPDPSRQAEALK